MIHEYSIHLLADDVTAQLIYLHGGISSCRKNVGNEIQSAKS
jgi:hypothetical protein